MSSDAFEKLYKAVAEDGNLELVKAMLYDAPHDRQTALLKQQNSCDYVWRFDFTSTMPTNCG